MTLCRVLPVFLSILTFYVAAEAAPPVKDYADLIVGKWDIRTQEFEFRSDGTASMLFERGTWSINKDVLTLNWTHRTSPNDKPLGLQVVPIRFITPDLWEWRSDRGPWQATRIGKRPTADRKKQELAPKNSAKSSNVPADEKSNTPLRVVYNHVNKTQGQPRNKIVEDTREKLGVRYESGGESFIYVFLLKSQSGNQAEVWTGPDRAGVDTVYRLKQNQGKWRIVSTEDTDL